MEAEKILVIDTETANSLDDPFPYDVGGQITDRKGRVYEKFSFMNLDVLCDSQLMETAYYKEKLPRYWEDARCGRRILATSQQIRSFIYDLCKRWNVVAICAHNARFDVKALNTLIRWETKSANRYFLPYGIPIWDTMQMALDVVATQKTYQKWCAENGYMTKHKVPRCRVTAEILYRYISGDDDFVESHTGLEDVEIETQILAYCFRQHKHMNKELYK